MARSSTSCSAFSKIASQCTEAGTAHRREHQRRGTGKQVASAGRVRLACAAESTRLSKGHCPCEAAHCPQPLGMSGWHLACAQQQLVASRARRCNGTPVSSDESPSVHELAQRRLQSAIQEKPNVQHRSRHKVTLALRRTWRHTCCQVQTFQCHTRRRAIRSNLNAAAAKGER